MPVNKKQKETAILELIYDGNELAEVVASERPDFRVRQRRQQTYFGVEVTELYQSDSGARLRNIPNYFSEILNDNTYRHRADRDALKVEHITITSAEGKDKGSTRGIFQQLPSIEEYLQMIARTIANKESKLEQYEQGLSHVNLIVFDTVNRVRTAAVEDFCWLVLKEPIKRVVYGSEFREIFLITVLEKDRWVYIPLKLMLLMETFFLFGKIAAGLPSATQHPPSKKFEASVGEFMSAFASYMRSKTNDVYVRDENTCVEVVFGNSGLILEEERVLIRDYNDYSLPREVRVLEDYDVALFSDETFREKEEEILTDYVFSTELAFDVKKKVEF